MDQLTNKKRRNTMDVKKILSGINEDFIKKGASSINIEDVKKVMDNAEDIKEKVIKSGPLQRFINDVVLLISMVKDYWTGIYRKFPWWVIAAVVFALLYVLSPIDMIPDFIPGVGMLDDALVMGLCLALIKQDLSKYQEWKEEQRNL
jgi:uncharacterized membrane protein YkvA (DUF1232 family)